jgi:hypothetical protein
VSRPPQHDSKRQKVSVGEKLSDATAPDEVPKLQLFGAFTTEDGAAATTAILAGGPCALWPAQRRRLRGRPPRNRGACVQLLGPRAKRYEPG